MARPTRNNAEYFTHPASFRNDRRVKAIRARFGVAGYGLLLMILETLTDADYTRLDVSELEVELIAGDFGVSVTEIHSLLQFAQKIELMSLSSKNILSCPDLDKWLEQVFDKRNRSREVVESRKTIVSVTETPVTATEIPQSKVKESKVKEKSIAGSGEPLTAPTEVKPDKPVKQFAYPDEFEAFWIGSEKPTASKKSAYLEWQKLKPEERATATAKLVTYKAWQPEARFRQDPERYLKRRTYENDFAAGLKQQQTAPVATFTKTGSVGREIT